LAVSGCVASTIPTHRNGWEEAESRARSPRAGNKLYVPQVQNPCAGIVRWLLLQVAEMKPAREHYIKRL